MQRCLPETHIGVWSVVLLPKTPITCLNAAGGAAWLAIHLILLGVVFLKCYRERRK